MHQENSILMDSNNVFSEPKLIWSNNLSIGSNPSPPKKTVIKHLIRRKHCWLRRAKEQGRPKIFFPVFLLVQDLPQCKGCAKDVQDPVKSLCKGSTSMYKNKYVQGYARSLPSTAVVQNLYETCTRLQYSVCRNEAASIRNGSAKTLCSADLRYAMYAY